MFNINKYDTMTLAKIWNTLNHWGWAEELGNKPEDWDDMPNYIPNTNTNTNTNTKYFINTPIMNEIENAIGIKECLRWHHINNLDSTNTEFETWWKTKYNILEEEVKSI